MEGLPYPFESPRTNSLIILIAKLAISNWPGMQRIYPYLMVPPGIIPGYSNGQHIAIKVIDEHQNPAESVELKKRRLRLIDLEERVRQQLSPQYHLLLDPTPVYINKYIRFSLENEVFVCSNGVYFRDFTIKIQMNPKFPHFTGNMVCEYYKNAYKLGYRSKTKVCSDEFLESMGFLLDDKSLDFDCIRFQLELQHVRACCYFDAAASLLRANHPDKVESQLEKLHFLKNFRSGILGFISDELDSLDEFRRNIYDGPFIIDDAVVLIHQWIFLGISCLPEPLATPYIYDFTNLEKPNSKDILFAGEWSSFFMLQNIIHGKFVELQKLQYKQNYLAQQKVLDKNATFPDSKNPQKTNPSKAVQLDALALHQKSPSNGASAETYRNNKSIETMGQNSAHSSTLVESNLQMKSSVKKEEDPPPPISNVKTRKHFASLKTKYSRLNPHALPSFLKTSTSFDTTVIQNDTIKKEYAVKKNSSDKSNTSDGSSSTLPCTDDDYINKQPNPEIDFDVKDFDPKNPYSIMDNVSPKSPYYDQMLFLCNVYSLNVRQNSHKNWLDGLELTIKDFDVNQLARLINVDIIDPWVTASTMLHTYSKLQCLNEYLRIDGSFVATDLDDVGVSTPSFMLDKKFQLSLNKTTSKTLFR